MKQEEVFELISEYSANMALMAALGAMTTTGYPTEEQKILIFKLEKCCHGKAFEAKHALYSKAGAE